MVILHNGGFTYEERVSYVEVIYSNTIQSMQAVLEALPLLDLHLQEGSMEAAGYVEELDPDERNTDGRVREAIEILWEDPALKEAVGEFCPTFSSTESELMEAQNTDGTSS
jgi:guanine nucleotide-binding protein G(i) subunit alpha